MPTNFLTLKEILAELKEENSITALRKYCQDEWEFYDLLRDLMNNEDFKQACIDKSFNESCQKDLDHYIELANQAKKAVSKYFERKDIELQAYYTETNDADRVLNINLTKYDGNEPVRISDILQQEKNISELNVYCDKKHDIYAHRESKKRYYEFKEGAYYEMTSTWPIKDESGTVVSTCIMVMNVSNDGITEILEFNGRSFTASDEVLGLIEQNRELYIQGLSLYDAVKALLEKNKTAPLPDVVPTADNNLQNNESIRVDQDKELDRQGLENNADNSPISPTNSDASTQTEVDLQQVATQVEIHSQPIATQPKVGLRHTETQTEVTTQYVEAQTETDSQPIATQQEIKELNKQRNDLQRELERAKQTIIVQGKETENLQAEKNKIHEESRKEVEKLNEKLEEAKQKIEWLERGSSNLQSELEKEKQKNVELEKYNDDLQNEFRKEGQKNIELQANLAQKNKELANLQKKTQELENVREEKEGLKKKKEELLSKLRELQKELNQLKEEKYSLEDENDQLKRSNKGLEKEKEQLLQKISGLEEVLLSLEGEKQALSDRLSNGVEKRIKLKQELIKTEQEIEKLGKENNSLQAEYEEKEQKLKKEMGKIYERITQLDAEQEQKVQELYEKNKELEEKLKIVDVRNRKLKDELEESKRAEQQTYEKAVLATNENHKTMQDLHAQLQKLKQENQEVKECYICTTKKSEHEIEDLKNELESEKKQREQLRQEIKEEIMNEYGPKLESKFKEYDNEIEMLEERDKELQKIVADKVQEIENLKGELQNKKEGEIFRNQTKALGKDIHLLASKQIDLNQAYTITADVLNDPDNVPLKKRKLSRSLSIDNGYDSGKESYNNRRHSPLSFVSNPVKVNSACTGQSECSNYSSIYP